jgi:hypothetical protein
MGVIMTSKLIKCPKHSTGGGPCYCGKTPSVVEPSREYDADAAHIAALEDEIAALEQERDELAAKVERLEQVYDDAAILGLYTVSFDSGASHKALCRLSHKVRSEPRSASLKLHDADVLDGVVQEFYDRHQLTCSSLKATGINHGQVSVLQLVEKIAALRKQAQEQAK